MVDRLPIALVAALVGWCLGWASAWLSDWLMVKDDLPRAGRSLWIRDPLVQVGSAMVGAGAAWCTPMALFFGVLFGAVIAVGLLVAGRSRYTTMPYGPGLCLGGLVALFWC